LARRVTANSDVFIYYSGHGALDIKTKSPYLIPYDIDPNYASTGFHLDQLYKNLHSLRAKSVTVILDACFSGQSREEKMMLADARPAGITIRESLSLWGHHRLCRRIGKADKLRLSRTEARAIQLLLPQGAQGYG